jgi:hypothetical protein
LQALLLAAALSERGLLVSHLTVGAVSVTLAGASAAPSMTIARPTSRKSVIEEYGGAEMAKMFADDGDLVDDEDQPAVRS